MDRRDLILKHISKTQRGIEIGPWFNPLVPKRDGYSVLTLDVFDSETLRSRAKSDPNIPENLWQQIEDVDLVGSATNIGDLIEQRGEVGQFDYIVSSHNFEHSPNPIRFLQGCAKALKPDGIISMAIPDRRGCFDFFRPVTKLADWIEASFDEREKPTLAQFFDTHACPAEFDTGAEKIGSFAIGAPIEAISARMRLDFLLEQWTERSKGNKDEYLDAHCSVFTPSSFALLIKDCAYLGILPFEVTEVTESGGNEFYVHLRMSASRETPDASEYEQIRNGLLRRIIVECSYSGDAENRAALALNKNEALKAEMAALNHTVAAAQEQEITLRRKIDDMAASIAETNAVILSKSIAAESAIAESLRLQREIAAIRSSTSWRITAPLRKIVSPLLRLVKSA